MNPLQGHRGLVDPGIRRVRLVADIDHIEVGLSRLLHLAARLQHPGEAEPGTGAGEATLGGLAIGLEGLRIASERLIGIAQEREGVGVVFIQGCIP